MSAAFFRSVILAAACLIAMPAAVAHEYDAPMKKHFAEVAAKWVNDEKVISAIKAQNQASAALTPAQIDVLDKEWRSGVDAGGNALIKKVMDNPLSAYLKKVQADSKGLYTEIIVMDNKGLNVGLSSMTSDYWQGDEAKFSKSFGAGKNAVFVDEVEQDESTRAFQSQISATISDEAGNPIGAVTIGINVDGLK
jgi:sensor histidine kinase regulating citrate/malate metabolism